MAACALLLAASALPEMRFGFGGFRVHPFNFAELLLFVAVIPRLAAPPLRITLTIVAFTGLLVVSVLLDPMTVRTDLLEPDGMKIAVKTVVAMTTVILGAAAVRNPADFRTATIAMALAGTAIALRGFAGGEETSVEGINPLEGIANKNAFSMYVLPPMLLGGAVALRSHESRWIRLLALACVLIMTVAVFSSGNRSGWLGVGIVSLALGIRAVRRVRSMLLMGALAVGSLYIFSQFGNIDVLERRISQTREGYSSDTLRVGLIQSAFEVGLSSPLVGVSPQRVPLEIARLSPIRGDVIDTHNVFALIGGGGGLMVVVPFILLGFMLWRRPERWRLIKPSPQAAEAHFLLRSIVILWAVRGFFSAEILYSPAFSLAWGITIGLCVATDVWAPVRAKAARGRTISKK